MQASVMTIELLRIGLREVVGRQYLLNTCLAQEQDWESFCFCASVTHTLRNAVLFL